MRKSSLMTSGLALAIALTMISSCNKGKEETVKQEVRSEQGKSAGTNIAYVEIDSLMSQYKFCKDYTLVLTKKSESIQATLNSKGMALQNAAAAFQKKVQSGQITQEQAQKEQVKLQQQQQSLQTLQEKLSKEFEAEQQKYNTEMRDSIQSFLKDYNKSHGYSMIISKAGDNILYSDKQFDITNDVINGLNKRYQGNKAKK